VDEFLLKTIHIVASCTERKRLQVPSALRLRTVRAQNASDRVKRWWQILGRARQKPMIAADLYLGDHWSIIKSLPEVASEVGLQAFLWVASAGYGLIPENAPICPYSATFATGHPDSVFTDQLQTPKFVVLRSWWNGLSRLSGPVQNVPRSLKAIAHRDNAAAILVVGSSDYIGAMEEDLMAAAGILRDSRRLIVVSTPATGMQNGLQPHLVPSSARLLAGLGGARPSLHARVARKIISEASKWELRADVLKVRYEGLLTRSPQLRKFDRETMTDQQVSKFIHAKRRRNPGLSCSRLLRTLRDSGHACEQARFKVLFQQITEAECG
jgi:hypothetical protein